MADFIMTDNDTYVIIYSEVCTSPKYVATTAVGYVTKLVFMAY